MLPERRGKSSVFKNVGSNWIVTLVTVAVTYQLTPYVLHTVGVQAYGTWLLITSLLRVWNRT